jgi:hypothetical protein
MRELTYTASLPKKRKKYIPLFTLILFAFSAAFFSRVLTLVKIPSIINLVHYAIIPSICGITLVKTQVKDRKQIAISKELLIALFVFFTINIASALLNDGALINACLNFLFLCEHFLLLLAIISIPFTAEKLVRFQKYILFASFTNLLFAYVQKYVLKLDLRQGLEDNIKGVFIGGGAGHVVGASVSLTFGVYYFFTAKQRPIWLRTLVVLATFWHMNMADAKQVLLVFLVAGVLLLLTKFKNIGQALQYLIFFFLLAYALYWAIYNIPALSGFLTWARPEIYGPQGEATLLKTATFRIVPTYYHSPLNPWLGIGPGHTVGRLGGWMLENYKDLLSPLGATVHPASAAIWKAVAASWLGDKSSMFSPLFGWAGIWGDLGFLGLGSFIYIWFVVWRRLCFDDISRFFVLTVFVFGLVFSQMEEPGYMLYVTLIIGLRWHEYRVQKQTARR